VTTVKNGKCSVKKHGLGDACNLHCTAIPRYNAVRLAPIRYYPAIAFQPFLGVARFPPYVTLFVSTFSTFKLKLSHYTPWRRLGERRYSSYSFSTPALDGGEWSTSRPGRALAPEERTPGTHCTGGWVVPRAGLDTEARRKILTPLPGIELQLPGSPARSQTLYWLSYPEHS
jgi:hypothetical protein